MAKIYTVMKKKVDDAVYAYICNRLNEPVTSTDAYMVGAVDEDGSDAAETDKDWALTDLDRLLFRIRRQFGGQIPDLPVKYDDVSPLRLMLALRGCALDTEKYESGVNQVVAAIEEGGYLPAENRSGGDSVEHGYDERGMSYSERVSFAFTVAQFLLYTVELERYPSSDDYASLLQSVEATFGIRSVGSREEVVKYIRDGRNGDTSDITESGLELFKRVAKIIVENNLLMDGLGLPGNRSNEWRAVVDGLNR